MLRRAQRHFRKRSQAASKSHVAKWRASADARKSVTVGSDKGLLIMLPQRLDFEENYESTVEHFRILRDATRRRLRVRKLQFDEIEFISPAAALVLASEVDRWNQSVGGRLRADVSSWNVDIRRLLCEMGFFELLKLPRPQVAPSKNTVTFLNFISGESGVGDTGKLAQQLRINIEAIVEKGIRRRYLFEGLSEAITNVSQHAYPNSFNQHKKQWWVSASFDKQHHELYVMFYDQGAGIPKTLPSSEFFESMRSLFGRWSDSQKIQAAMEYGRSATGKTERGKGLSNLVEFAKVHEQGRLSIYSQRGLFRIAHKDLQQVNDRRDHKNSIGGTLIEWSVKL